jgi:hypothetical protein
MQLRMEANEWHKAVWKVVTNPAIEVMAVIVVVLLAAWVVVETEVDQRTPAMPVIFGVK